MKLAYGSPGKGREFAQTASHTNDNDRFWVVLSYRH
jgi:hypothetical protein